MGRDASPAILCSPGSARLPSISSSPSMPPFLLGLRRVPGGGYHRPHAFTCHFHSHFLTGGTLPRHLRPPTSPLHRQRQDSTFCAFTTTLRPSGTPDGNDGCWRSHGSFYRCTFTTLRYAPLLRIRTHTHTHARFTCHALRAAFAWILPHDAHARAALRTVRTHRRACTATFHAPFNCTAAFTCLPHHYISAPHVHTLPARICLSAQTLTITIPRSFYLRLRATFSTYLHTTHAGDCTARLYAG